MITIVDPPDDNSIFPSFPLTSSSCAACFSKADPLGRGFRFGAGDPMGLCTVPGSDVFRGGGISAVRDLRVEEVDAVALGVDPRRSPNAIANGAEPCLRRGSSALVEDDCGCCAACVESPGMAEACLPNSPPPDMAN